MHVPEKYEDLEDFETLALESSMSTLKAVALPRHLLDLSVVLFMVGIGLYELSGWKNYPGFRGTAYRDVFIVFIVTILTYLIYHTLILIGAAYDTNKKDDEFGTGSLRGAWREKATNSRACEPVSKTRAQIFPRNSILQLCLSSHRKSREHGVECGIQRLRIT